MNSVYDSIKHTKRSIVDRQAKQYWYSKAWHYRNTPKEKFYIARGLYYSAIYFNPELHNRSKFYMKEKTL